MFELISRPRRSIALLLLVVLLLSPGCASIINIHAGPDYWKSRVGYGPIYGGVQGAWQLITRGDEISSFFGVLDMPMAVLADTFLLPATIPLAIVYRDHVPGAD